MNHTRRQLNAACYNHKELDLALQRSIQMLRAKTSRDGTKEPSVLGGLRDAYGMKRGFFNGEGYDEKGLLPMWEELG